MFKTWADLDVLSAADVNNYLMKQSVIVCTSGTRPGSPVDGMFIYETDTKRLMKWNASFWEVVAGSRTSHTPVLTASSSNPTLGTGAIALGWYTFSPGSTLTYSFYIQFGSSGTSAGSGQYQISLPVTAVGALGSQQPAMGSGMIRRNSNGEIRAATVYIPGTALGIAGMIADSTHGAIGSVAPWSAGWTVGDYLAGSITYPV